MSFYGNLIGLAVEEVGKKKDVQELSTEEYSLMNIKRLQESTFGLIGEHNLTSRKLTHTSGRRNFKISITLMMKLSSRSLRRSLLMMAWEE